MKIIETSLSGIYILRPEPKVDLRGSFMRTFSNDMGLPFEVKQINQSLTRKKGTLRGLHFQKNPKAEKKIVQCIQGSIFDVVININTNSNDYGKYFSIILSSDKPQLLYISEGFAHGFQTLKNNTVLQYLMSEYYSPEHASGVAWNDPFFHIPWPLDNPMLSDKDSKWEFIKR